MNDPMNQNPYDQSNPYQNGYANSQSNPYAQGSPYAQNNPYMQGTPYTQTQNNTQGNSYMHANTSAPKKKKEKASKGFGAKLGKCVAIAAVFGLVAGSVFTGVSFAGNKLIGMGNTNQTQIQSSTDNSTNTGTNTNNTPDKGNTITQTATGVAKELTDVSQIVEEVMPSIVAITNTGTVTYQNFWGQSYSYETESCGSGIIIGQDDKFLYIASNNHVVSDAEKLTVQFADNETVNGVVQGSVVSNDLAVVKVELKNIPQSTKDVIKVAAVGDSQNLKVGEPTIAIGNALGYGQSVTTGVVSALGRTVSTQDPSTGATITNTNLIQTDAAINPGNSGGALLNGKGEVIGINSVKYADTEVEGIGYAIPMSDAMDIITQLIETGTVTEAQTAYLGIQGNDVSNSVSQAYGIPEGVYVHEVIAGSGAEQAGIRKGDVITAFEGNSISSMQMLKSTLEAYEAGDTVTITISRLGQNGYEEMKVDVVLSPSSISTN